MPIRKLKMKRVLNDYTTDHIANLLGIHRYTYSLKENGKTEFSAKEISSLMKILKLTPDEVVDIFLN